MNPNEIADQSVKALEDKKGLNIEKMMVKNITTLADYIIVATGTSRTHINALADEVEFQLSEKGITVSHIEGHKSESWILLDYGSVIINIFSKEARSFYDLERLWQH